MQCSTIIPTVGRSTLERAVRSALNQDLEAGQHEVIVVNDSGEPLPEADWLLSPQVTVVNTNRCERSVACNVGAAVATGKYLKILHDDDYLLPGALKTLVDVAEASGCDLVYGALHRVDNENVFMSIDQPTVKGNLFALLAGGDCLHPGAILIRREAFFRAGGFDPHLKVREDYDLEWRLALQSDVERTDQVVVVVRVGREGSTTSWARVAQEHSTVREKTLGLPEAFGRIRASVQGDLLTRGRGCRTYLASAYANFAQGRYATSLTRLFACLRLAAWHPIWPEFWRGLAFRTVWHEGGRQMEEAHFTSPHTGPRAEQHAQSQK